MEFCIISYGFLLIFCLEIFMKAQGINFSNLRQACRTEDGLQRISTSCKWRFKLYGKNAHSNNVNCTDEEFTCRPIFKCIHRRYLNTHRGCFFGRGNKENILVPCRNDEFGCDKSGICVPRWAVGDGEPDCVSKEVYDSSDETTEPYQECLRMEYRCQDSGRCIPREWVLDDHVDCLDGTDEMLPLTNCYAEEEFRCKMSGRCIRRYRVMDGFSDCSLESIEDDSDELHALHSCSSTSEFHCQSNGRCIPRSWMMDGTKNCIDGSDEEIPKNSQCTDNEFRCHNGRRCILSKYLCDGMDHCGDCSDEIEGCDEPRMWRCPNDPLQKCISQSYFCDALNDCPNGRDNPNYLPGFKCNIKIGDEKETCPIPQWTLSNRHAICKDKSDICFTNGTFKCAHCERNKALIGKHQVCDGIVDCIDLWDECLCTSEHSKAKGRENEVSYLCDNVCYGEGSIPCERCDLGEIYCEHDEKCIRKNAVCDGKIDCPISKLDERFCTNTKVQLSGGNAASFDFDCWKLPSNVITFLSNIGVYEKLKEFMPEKANKCDGVLECARFEDECSPDCPVEMKQCKKFKMHNLTISTVHISDSVPFPVRACSDFDPNDIYDFLGYIGGKSICNGVSECKDNADEEDCEERHYCDGGTIQWVSGVKNIVNVGSKEICNVEKDCNDYSDEMNCTDDDHYYCDSGEPLFVPEKVVLDGKQDCEDNSDECPPSLFEDDPFSSPYEMIGNPFLRGLVWLMATLGILGNAGVLMESFLSDFHSKKKPSSMSRCNRMLIVNLASSDFLMGVALVAIGINSSLMSGEYCLQEKRWRISNVCSTIGVLTVLSSETSVFALTLLTFYRVYGVFFPFKSRHVKARRTLYAIAVTWILSALFAFGPVVSKVNESMLTDALISPSVYFKSTVVQRSIFQRFTLRTFVMGNRSEFHKSQVGTWRETVKGLQEVYPEYVPEVLGYFGYYSSHGVCMPRLFRSEDSPPLHPLSIFIITLNFCCLLFIIISYCLIYRKSSSRGKIAERSSREDKTKSMQRKITVLIATDLCCWLPICAMTFLSQAGIPVSKVVYAVAAIVFLPINSSVNPFIYSNGFEFTRELLMQKLGFGDCGNCTRTRGDKSQRKQVSIEMEKNRQKVISSSIKKSEQTALDCD